MQIVTIIEGILHFKDVEVSNTIENTTIIPNRFKDINEYEFYEERAAIVQFDAGLTKEEAEQLAWERVIVKRHFLNQKSFHLKKGGGNTLIGLIYK